MIDKVKQGAFLIIYSCRCVGEEPADAGRTGSKGVQEKEGGRSHLHLSFGVSGTSEQDYLTAFCC